MLEVLITFATKLMKYESYGTFLRVHTHNCIGATTASEGTYTSTWSVT